ncbi:MAG TPA: DUF4397 domain-containing protein [Thermomicrobiales bacterium]|nr:DUF4397 domain-containing protein [Thermomicrobiales bacterium]
MTSRFAKLVFGLTLALMLASIGSAAVAAQDSGTPAAQGSFPVSITFVNGMTSLSAVDVYLNGTDKDQRVVEGLKYGDVSESFEGTAPGTVVTVKQNVNFGIDRYLYQTLVPTAAGQSYVVVISDFVLIPVQVDLSQAAADAARTVAVHAASEAPAVDIYATPSGQQFSIGNVVPVVTNVKYGTSTAGGTVVAGAYDINLTQTGTDTEVLQQDGVTIDAGQSYVFVLIGQPGSTEQPLTLVTVSQPLVS